MTTVTVALPVYNEAAHIGATLEAVAAQTYGAIVEVLVVDGGSTDDTRSIAAAHPAVRVLHNPHRIQASALNIALAEAKGEIVVRIDGHCLIAPDYVERCVATLDETGAAMVGGAMTPVAESWMQRGVAEAMASPFGAGPARFHVGGEPGWVDSVYLGAYRTDTVRAAGGYREDVGVNEDAELAIRMRRRGGVWFDPSIRSTYTPRGSLRAVTRQFYRYGRSRAATLRQHPSAVALRQLAAPALVVGLASPWRRPVAVAYAGVLVLAGARQLTRDPATAPTVVAVLPAMHLSWGAGLLRGLVGGLRQMARPGR